MVVAAVMVEVAVGTSVVGAMSAAVGILPAVAIEVVTPVAQAMADIEADMAGTEATVDIEADMAGAEATVVIEADMAGMEVGVAGAGVASGSGSISRRFPTTTQRFGTPACLTTMRMIITTNGTATWVSTKL